MKVSLKIFLGYIIFVSVQCSLIVGNQKDNQNERNILTFLALNQGTKKQGCNLISKTNNIGTFTDCSDGTVKYEGAGYFDGDKLTYAKCPVGYTFDGTKCTGSLQKFLWCGDNINSNNFSTSCETNLVLTSGPTFDACDKFILGGKKWRVPSPIEAKKLIVCKDGTSPISNPPVAFEMCGAGNVPPFTVADLESMNSTHKEIFPKIPIILTTNLAFDNNDHFRISFGNTQEDPTGGKSSPKAVLCVSDE